MLGTDSHRSRRPPALQRGVQAPGARRVCGQRRQDGDAPAAGLVDANAPAFLLAEIGEGSDALELTLPGGITARAATPGQARLLAALIAALR